MGSEAEKWKKLKEAYIYEAFASHYLTDLFSSGHIRAPRRYLHSPNVLTMNLLGAAKEKLHCEETPIWDYQLRYVSSTTRKDFEQADFMKQMHDDDSATGILVQNKLGHQWIMYGKHD
jgi:hypothetical protein